MLYFWSFRKKKDFIIFLGHKQEKRKLLRRITKRQDHEMIAFSDNPTSPSQIYDSLDGQFLICDIPGDINKMPLETMLQLTAAIGSHPVSSIVVIAEAFREDDDMIQGLKKCIETIPGLHSKIQIYVRYGTEEKRLSFCKKFYRDDEIKGNLFMDNQIMRSKDLCKALKKHCTQGPLLDVKINCYSFLGIFDIRSRFGRSEVILEAFDEEVSNTVLEIDHKEMLLKSYSNVIVDFVKWVNKVIAECQKSEVESVWDDMEKLPMCAEVIPESINAGNTEMLPEEAVDTWIKMFPPILARFPVMFNLDNKACISLFIYMVHNKIVKNIEIKIVMILTTALLECCYFVAKLDAYSLLFTVNNITLEKKSKFEIFHQNIMLEL